MAALFAAPIIAEGNLARALYHRLSVIQRFNALCDRS
jgi:hypothetical protein